MGLLPGDLGNGAAPEGVLTTSQQVVREADRCPPYVALPAPRLGPQGQASGSPALILSRCFPGNGSPPWGQDSAWCSVAGAQSRGVETCPTWAPKAPRLWL